MIKINITFFVIILSVNVFSQVNQIETFESEFIGSQNWQVYVPNGNYDNNWCIDQSLYSIDGKSAQICNQIDFAHQLGYTFSNSTGSGILAKKYTAYNHFNLALRFDWKCNGEEGKDYGIVYYSQDNGNNWIELKSQIRNGAPNNIITETIVLPRCLDGTQFLIGFSFVSDNSFNFQPGLVIDNVMLIGDNCSAYPNQPSSPNNPVVCFDYLNPVKLTLASGSNSLRWYYQNSCGEQFHQGNELWKIPTESKEYWVSSFNTNTGCESPMKTKITLVVRNKPNINLISLEPTKYGSDGKVEVFVDGTTAPYYYSWRNVIDTSQSLFNGPNFMNIEAGNYKLRVVDSQSPQCDSIVYYNIPEGSELKIPNAISPNSDGLNDTWDIIGLYQIEDFIMEIYTLSGTMVFTQIGAENNGIYIPFSGKNNNDVDLLDGDYLYVIKSKIKDRKFKGILTIKRK